MQTKQLIYDWNRLARDRRPLNCVEICDESLRDGIQSPSVIDPKIKKKLELIDLMEQLGITIANIGLPAAGPRAFQDVLQIAQYVSDRRYNLQMNCAARTLKVDIEPIASIQQKTGSKIIAYCFLGTSPIRQMVENWDLEKLKETTEAALRFANQENLEVAFVTEDTTRSHKDTLTILFNHAISIGVKRLVLCDTVGHSTPNGVRALVSFTKELIKESKQKIKIDWHGHNDRGLAVANAIFAAEYGCDRIHGTALGIGERIGNTSIDQLIVNLKLLGAYQHDVSGLKKYVEKAAKIFQVPLPSNYPVFGIDAFRTTTGVHAAAVVKAKNKGDHHLADTIYSGVPAHWFGKMQTIEIGPMSGTANVKHWLLENRIEPYERLVKEMITFAKTQSKTLTNEEIKGFIKNYEQQGLLPQKT